MVWSDRCAGGIVGYPSRDEPESCDVIGRRIHERHVANETGLTLMASLGRPLVSFVGRGIQELRELSRIRRTSADDTVYFGDFLDALHQARLDGGSELAVGLSLFALTVSIRAEAAIEIGTFKGFSALAIASGLRFLDRRWTEPKSEQSRPDVDYQRLLQPKQRRLYCVDPTLMPHAVDLVRKNHLMSYVEFITCRSEDVNLDVAADLVFIDGDHTYDGCRRDVERFVKRNLRQGGYFVLHDYFGWFDDEGKNRSPIKQVCDELVASGAYEHLLVDTHSASMMVFRKL